MYRAFYLYNFIGLCEESSLPKEVLELGAGISEGFVPLLKRFYDRGYKTYGIDISDERIENFKEYLRKHDLTGIEISKSDMAKLDFDDSSVSFVYSYNSIFHLLKKDIQRTVSEVKRVLSKGGLGYINFLSMDDGEYGDGENIGDGQYIQHCKTMGRTVHSFYDKDEADSLFNDVTLLYKERRICELPSGPSSYIDYIFRK